MARAGWASREGGTRRSRARRHAQHSSCAGGGGHGQDGAGSGGARGTRCTADSERKHPAVRKAAQRKRLRLEALLWPAATERGGDSRRFVRKTFKLAGEETGTPASR